MLQSSIRRGELDREISLIKEIIVDDAANAGSNNGWELVDENPVVKARKKELAGKEVVVGDRLTYVQATIWTIVYRTDLTTRNRVVFKGKPYEITAITEEGREQYLHLYANLLDTEQWP